MSTEIQNDLNQLWSGQITHFQHNFLNYCLTLIVQVVGKGGMLFYRVFIEKISTIIFDEPSIEVTEDYNWNYMEMISIDYFAGCKFQYYPDFVYDTSGYDRNKCIEYEKIRKKRN